MKKITLILLLLLSSISFSQDSRIFENTWYLHDLIIDGMSNIPPSNNEIPFVAADFYENGEIYTGMCMEAGGGQLEYVGSTEFEVLSMAFLAGGCHENWPVNQSYSSLYISFWSYADTYLYEIIQHENSRTLIITKPNNDVAIYGSEMIMSTNDIANNEFSIYPTIVKSTFSITSNSVDEITKVTIFNSSGQIVYEDSDNNSEINISHLPTGVFLVHLQNTAGKVITKRIIKF